MGAEAGKLERKIEYTLSGRLDEGNLRFLEISGYGGGFELLTHGETAGGIGADNNELSGRDLVRPRDLMGHALQEREDTSLHLLFERL